MRRDGLRNPEYEISGKSPEKKGGKHSTEQCLKEGGNETVAQFSVSVFVDGLRLYGHFIRSGFFISLYFFIYIRIQLFQAIGTNSVTDFGF